MPKITHHKGNVRLNNDESEKLSQLILEMKNAIQSENSIEMMEVIDNLIWFVTAYGVKCFDLGEQVSK